MRKYLAIALLFFFPGTAGAADIRVPAIPSNPRLAGEVFKTIRNHADPGSTLKLDAGYYLIPGDSDPGIPAADLTIEGAGMDETIVEQECTPAWQHGRLVAFELHNTEYRKLHLKVPTAPGLQNLCVGISGRPGWNPKGQVNRLTQCRITGQCEAVYVWAGYRCRLIIDRCEINAGRVGIGAWSSGYGPDVTWIDVHETTINCDWRRGPSAGISAQGGHFMCAVLSRRGTIRVNKCKIEMIVGDEPGILEKVVGLWATNIDSQPHRLHDQATIVHQDTTFRIEAGGVKAFKTLADIGQINKL